MTASTVNISGFGIIIQVRSTVTFPVPFTISTFADDADPFDIPSIQIADQAMELNGSMAVWPVANSIIVNIGVWPNSDEDKNLSILLNANRPSRGKRPANDIITMVGIYTDGSNTTLSEGIIRDGMPGKSVASAGRLKTKTYSFAFSKITSTS